MSRLFQDKNVHDLAHFWFLSESRDLLVVPFPHPGIGVRYWENLFTALRYAQIPGDRDTPSEYPTRPCDVDWWHSFDHPYHFLTRDIVS